MDGSAKETVIIVHGTFAGPKLGKRCWHQPSDSDPKGFIARLNLALQQRGSAARCWAHCSEADQGFRWSGKNSWVDRTQAAAELGDYVTKLRREGWRCHIVAHSHGGNVVVEALHQMAAALPSAAPLGRIVTLGTPFMDTTSPIRESIRNTQHLVAQLSRIIWWLIFLLGSVWAVVDSARSTGPGAALGVAVFASVIVFALLFFRRKNQTEPLFDTAAHIQPKFLAIGSRMDEPWQLLHHMRNVPNPLALETNLIGYLISSMKSHI
jgi:hypothetical protein